MWSTSESETFARMFDRRSGVRPPRTWPQRHPRTEQLCPLRDGVGGSGENAEGLGEGTLYIVEDCWRGGVPAMCSGLRGKRWESEVAARFGVCGEEQASDRAKLTLTAT
jgi:hypothetical protein